MDITVRTLGSNWSTLKEGPHTHTFTVPFLFPLSFPYLLTPYNRRFPWISRRRGNRSDGTLRSPRVVILYWKDPTTHPFFTSTTPETPSFLSLFFYLYPSSSSPFGSFFLPFHKEYFLLPHLGEWVLGPDTERTVWKPETPFTLLDPKQLSTCWKVQKKLLYTPTWTVIEGETLLLMRVMTVKNNSRYTGPIVR